MATNNLELRLAHTTMDITDSTVTLTETWEAWQPVLEVALNTFSKTVQSPVDAGFDSASEKLQEFAQSWFATVLAWHETRSAIDDYSLFDASNIMAWWSFTVNGSNFDLSHPVSGDYDDQAVTSEDGRPTLKGRIDAILALVPGPAAWMQSDSPSAETIRVKCVAVSGADHYDVYDDQGGGSFEKLGSVPDNSWNSISVAAGAYRVRVAAVTSGSVTGILSNVVPVVVQALGGSAMSVPTLMIEKEPSLTDAAPIPTIPLCSRWTWGVIQRLRRKR